MKRLKFFLLICLASAIASAEELSWDALVGRKELWPARCTVNRAIKFKQGGSVEAGQQLKVVALEPTRVLATTLDGRFRFALKPEDTDILQLASGGSARLTPQQRELTYAAVLQRKDLWPYRVALTEPVELGAGGSMALRRGEKVILMGVEGGQLLVATERFNTSFDLDARQTDLLPQARQFAQNKSGAPGRFLEELEGKLVNPTNGAPAPLDANSLPNYLVFYRGAGWCGPCREFSPSLIKSYQKLKPAHPEFEVIFISDDKSPTELRNYAKEVGFSWPTLTSNRYKELHIINPMFGQSIPQLVVTDRHGKVLIDSGKIDRLVALQKLEVLLKESTGQK
jgi:thiol-disulfide isomerase/thioredoxin